MSAPFAVAVGHTDVDQASHHRRSLVAFSPCGRFLAAAGTGGVELFELDDDGDGSETPRLRGHASPGGRAAALAFASPDLLAVVATERPATGTSLEAFHLPELEPRAASLRLEGPLPSLVLGHPDRPWLLLSPRPESEWRRGADPGSGDAGFTVVDLERGGAEWGGGPLATWREHLSLAWAGADVTGLTLGRLATWTRNGSKVEGPAVDGGFRAVALASAGGGGECGGGGAPTLVGYEQPPRLATLDANRSVVLGGDEERLLHVAIGSRHVAAVVASPRRGRDPRKGKAAAHVFGRETLEPVTRLDLPWPVAGFGLHPRRRVLAFADTSSATSKPRLRLAAF